MILAIVIAGSSSSSCDSREVTGTLGKQVPPKLVPPYEEAAAKFRLGPKGPAVLAAINFVETSFGKNVATSAAGAEGWMAFLPSTFAEWGVDGNGDGTKDIFNAADAIFSAADYLHDSGAPEDWWGAVFAYNHADWYVAKVLSYAKGFSAGAGEAVAVSVSSCGTPTAPNEAVARMLVEAERLSLLRPRSEYVYGGSHSLTPTPADGPFDCSSAVSHLLQVGGFGNPTMDTIGLAGWANQDLAAGSRSTTSPTAATRTLSSSSSRVSPRRAGATGALRGCGSAATAPDSSRNGSSRRITSLASFSVTHLGSRWRGPVSRVFTAPAPDCVPELCAPRTGGRRRRSADLRMHASSPRSAPPRRACLGHAIRRRPREAEMASIDQLRGAEAGTEDSGARLWTAEEVAELLGVSHEYVWQLSREGRIPTVSLGRTRRYRRESILAWLDQIETPGGRA